MAVLRDTSIVFFQHRYIGSRRQQKAQGNSSTGSFLPQAILNAGYRLGNISYPTFKEH